jgi:hypothetical protein
MRGGRYGNSKLLKNRDPGKMMKRRVLSLALLVAVSFVRAPEGTAGDTPGRGYFYAGAGLENSMNSPRFYALSEVATIHSDFSDHMAMGFKAGVSENFGATMTLETEAFWRIYPVKFRWGAVFTQWSLGESFIFDDSYFYPMLLCGFTAGVHIPIFGFLYVEPYARFGYPYMWGMGAVGGIRF